MYAHQDTHSPSKDVHPVKDASFIDAPPSVGDVDAASHRHMCRLRVQSRGARETLAASGLQICRAFALEGRGIWHALSMSATQQVYGPLRARADLRVALESPPAAGPAEEAGRATLEGAWKVRDILDSRL